MQELLQRLKDTKLVKVTGSFADGSQNGNSDIDFQVKENAPDQKYQDRNMLKIIKVLDEFGIKWNSTDCGYVSTIHEFNPTLERDLEFADHFKPRKNKLKEATLYQVTFKTN